MLQSFRNLVAMMRRLSISVRLMIFLFGLNMVAVLLEGLGVAMLLPIFELLRVGGSAESSELKGRQWDILRDVSSQLNIPLSLGLLLGVSFAFILLRQGVNYLNVTRQAIAQRSTANKVRQRAFLGFLRAQTGMQDKSRIGEIAGDLTVELNRALGSLFALVPTVSHVIQMAVYVTGLFLLSVPMTILSILTVGFAGYLARGYLAEIKRTGAAITDANMQITTFIVERLKHTRLIRLSGTEKAEASAFAKLSERHSVESMRQKIVGTRMSLIPEPLALGFGYFVVFVGAELFGLSLDRLALFVILLIRLLPIVRGLIADYTNIMGKWPSLEKIDRHLKALLESREEKGGDKVLGSLERDIVYDHVFFSYGVRDAPALMDVTVRLPAHRMSALVGPSGAGKSTFVDLLPRLRSPNAGQILFDGVPIKEFSIESLRAGIAFVPQQPQIFNISAAEHIRYGREDATDKEVREAARLAGALAFVESLPEGFDTLLGDGGFRLSVGQRQRLDIARALVRRATILILDEPTSALDAEAEAGFRDALRRLRAETYLTIIVIAHRLSTIADADQIVVLKKGRVDAVGSHEELLAAGGWYANAFRSQYHGRDRNELSVAVGK
jgi:ABC-type multidrug transport system fused ATPase/permease subunit